jgi:hypothetical protein
VSQERDRLEAELAKHHRWYDSGTRNWSAVHHGVLFAVPLLTAVSTVLTAIDFKHPGWQTSCTTLATVLATIAASQGFAKKWQANRRARSRIDQLMIQMTDPQVDLAKIRSQFAEIIMQQDEGILAAEHHDEARPHKKQKA